MSVSRAVSSSTVQNNVKVDVEKTDSHIQNGILDKIHACFATAKRFLEYLFTGSAMCQTVALGGVSLICFFKPEMAIPAAGIFLAHYSLLVFTLSIIDAYKFCKNHV